MEKVILKTFIKKQHVDAEGCVNAVDFLHEETGLSKALIKKIMTFGGFWRKAKDRGKTLRFRKAKGTLHKGDYVEFYYDPKIFNADIPEGELLLSNKSWGLWYKPSGLLTQGTKYGDAASLLRQVEKQRLGNKQGDAFLVNRLDREAAGIVMVAYTKQAAKLLGNLWREMNVRKFYQIQVLGDPGDDFGDSGDIDFDLDGKKALTTYKVHKTHPGYSDVWVEIKTGRYHQIRKHFDMIDHPVIGDPKYGEGNKNSEGMKLVASKVIFKDPFTRKGVEFQLPEKYLLF